VGFFFKISDDSSEALPQTDENRMETISPQRRRARRDDSSFFFAAETPAKKNAHALRARPDKLKQLTRSVRSFAFLPSSALWNAEPIPPGSAEKGKTFSSACPVKCEAYLTGAISVPLAKRAVRHRSIYIIAKLDINFKILAYIDI